MTEDDVDSIYKVVELVGSSPESFEKAVANVAKKAKKTIKDLRVIRLSQQDVRLDENGNIVAYRVRCKVSFKYHNG